MTKCQRMGNLIWLQLILGIILEDKVVQKSKSKKYFFFRGEYEVAEGTSAAVFNAILDYYRTGVIHCKFFLRRLKLNKSCFLIASQGGPINDSVFLFLLYQISKFVDSLWNLICIVKLIWILIWIVKFKLNLICIWNLKFGSNFFMNGYVKSCEIWIKLLGIWLIFLFVKII